MHNTLRFVLCHVILVAAGAASAQGIERKSEPYRVEQAFPVAPPIAAPVVVAAAAATTAAGQAAGGQEWDLQLKDINIAGAFHRWAAKAGYRVRWDAQKHFMVDAPDTLKGGFEEVVASVLESPGISQSAYPLEVCFYPNTPPLARITRKGDQDKECK